MKNDLIRRQDVLHELDGCDYELKDWQRWKLKTMVRDIPSAEHEIIRCKDCKHYAPEVGDDSYALGYCPFIGSHLVMSKGFCAWGERREE